MQNRFCRETRLPPCALNDDQLVKLTHLIERRFAMQSNSPRRDVTAYSSRGDQVEADLTAVIEQLARPLPNVPRTWVVYLLRHNDSKSVEVWRVRSGQEDPTGEIIGLSIEASSSDTTSVVRVTLGDWSRCHDLTDVPHTTQNRLYVCSDNKDWMLATAQEIERQIEPFSRRQYGLFRSRWSALALAIIMMAFLVVRGKLWEAGISPALWLINAILAVGLAIIVHITLKMLFPIFEPLGSGLPARARWARVIVVSIASILGSTLVSWAFQALLTR